MNLILATMLIFFLSHNLAIAETACESLDDKRGLNMVVGFGGPYFKGYNHGKGTNLKYSKSKMKKFMSASCAADPNITIDEIFANAVDTNFKPPSVDYSSGMNQFFKYLDKQFDGSTYRK